MMHTHGYITNPGAGEIVGCGDDFLELDSCFFWDPNQTVAYADNNGTLYPNFNHRKVVSYFTGDRKFFEKASHGTHVSKHIYVFVPISLVFAMLWGPFSVRRLIWGWVHLIPEHPSKMEWPREQKSHSLIFTLQIWINRKCLNRPTFLEPESTRTLGAAHTLTIHTPRNHYNTIA